jgi:hypothetical protein
MAVNKPTGDNARKGAVKSAPSWRPERWAKDMDQAGHDGSEEVATLSLGPSQLLDGVMPLKVLSAACHEFFTTVPHRGERRSEMTRLISNANRGAFKSDGSSYQRSALHDKSLNALIVRFGPCLMLRHGAVPHQFGPKLSQDLLWPLGWAPGH